MIIFLIYREGLGEGYDGDIAFASSLEMFGGGHNDPISVAFGGLFMLSTYRHYFEQLMVHFISGSLFLAVVQ